MFHLQFAIDDKNTLDDAKMLERMRATLDIPDFSPKIHYISRWTMEGVLANKFQTERVFLAGNTAHHHPPTNNLKLNNAVHDVYNLSWKLATMLCGKAETKLLKTYDQERHPVDNANIETTINSTMNHYTINQALSLS